MSHAPRDVRRDLARRRRWSRGAASIALLLAIVVSPAAADGIGAAGAVLTCASTTQAQASAFAPRAPQTDAAVASVERGAAMPAIDDVEWFPDVLPLFPVPCRDTAFRVLPWRLASDRVESAPDAVWALHIPRAPPPSFCL